MIPNALIVPYRPIVTAKCAHVAASSAYNDFDAMYPWLIMNMEIKSGAIDMTEQSGRQAKSTREREDKHRCFTSCLELRSLSRSTDYKHQKQSSRITKGNLSQMHSKSSIVVCSCWRCRSRRE